MKILIVLISILSLSRAKSEPLPSAHKRLQALVASESYTHYEYIDEDNKDQFRLYWKLLENDEIQFEIHCKTSGWVGLGGMTYNFIIQFF